MRPEDFYELRYLAQKDSKERTMVHSMCEGKRRFDTKSEADRIIRQGKPISSYHCMVCNGWHVGAISVKRQKRLLLKRRREACESL